MDIDQINKSIEYIADNFGLESQMLKLIEECSELSRSLAMDIAKGKKISEDTLSEISDVNILINQVLYLSSNEEYNAKEKLKNNIEYKLRRTIQRINEGYYK